MWVESWIHEYDVRTNRDLARLLKERSPFKRAIKLATAEADAPADPEPIGTDAVIGGQPLDPGADVTCASYICAGQRAEAILPSLWTYFEKVVVSGLTPRLFLEKAS